MNVLVKDDEFLNVCKGQVAPFAPWLVGARVDGKGTPYHRTV
jgi:hypothetical protein